MFLGEFRHSLDVKGRLNIPSRYREEIGEQKLVATRGLDGNLVVYTEKGFEEYAARWMELSTGKADYRKWRRFVASTAEYCMLDKQGRILISENLRKHAGLVKEAVISGNFDNFEIWSPERWEEVSNFGDNEEISNRIEELDVRI